MCTHWNKWFLGVFFFLFLQYPPLKNTVYNFFSTYAVKYPVGLALQCPTRGHNNTGAKETILQWALRGNKRRKTQGGTTNVLSSSIFFFSDPQQVEELFLMQPNSLLSPHTHTHTPHKEKKIGRPWYQGSACNALSTVVALINRWVTAQCVAS